MPTRDIEPWKKEERKKKKEGKKERKKEKLSTQSR